MNSYKALDRNKEAGSTFSLLSKGMVPGIIYGKGSEPTKIALEDKLLKKLMNTGSFYSTIIDIDINGKVENGNCTIKYPKKIYCMYNQNNKILVSNGKSLVIKSASGYYRYPLKKTHLDKILDKSNKKTSNEL